MRRLGAVALAVMGCGGQPSGPAVAPEAETAASLAGSAGSAGALPPPPAIAPPRPPAPIEVHTERLASGLEVVTVERPGPLVTLVLSLPAGSLDDRPGVAELCAELVAHGGGSPHGTARDFDAAAAATGARVHAEVDARRTRLSMEVEPARLGPAIELLAGLVARDSLRARRYDVLRRVLMERRTAAGRDDGRWAAAELARRRALGSAVFATQSELSRVRLDHVKQYYAARYRPTGSRIIAVGDVAPDALRTRIEAAFDKRWTAGLLAPAPAEPRPGETSRDPALVDQPGAPRATLAVTWRAREMGPERLAELALLSERAREALSAAAGSAPAETEIELWLLPGEALLTGTVTLPTARAIEASAALGPVLELGAAGEPLRTAALERARRQLISGRGTARLVEMVRGAGGSQALVASHLARIAAASPKPGLVAERAAIALAADASALPGEEKAAGLVIVSALRAFAPVKPPRRRSSSKKGGGRALDRPP